LPSAGAGFTFTAEWRFTSLDYRRKKVIMGNKIFVGGLNWDATDDDLRETFGECGAITDAVIVNDRDTGRSRGFGFVTYSSDEEAKAAVEKFDGQDFMGRKLTVNEARQREDRGNGGGGGRGGGGRGGGRSGGGRRDNW
jgi:RNA recognition motif-containing protein